MRRLSFFVLLFSVTAFAQTFTVQKTQFLLDGAPFQIRSGEMHFQRIPPEYWKDRLLKTKAMGLNTVSTYVFWNALEPERGKWDLGGNNDLRRFILLAKQTGLFVILRPGPYACAEWDFGGLPPWLLRTPGITVRCMDRRYLNPAGDYIRKVAGQIMDLQNTKGGPVILLQIENEYGSFGNDKEYLLTLRSMWEKAGITIPTFTADGATQKMLRAGTIPGSCIGLDPGTSEEDFAEAAKVNPNVPVFCSEYYPGWLTHWGEQWAGVDTAVVLKDITWLLENRKSFNLYMLHGGTSFGWMAGANYAAAYQPDITSYDYDAPLNERGEPTPKYMQLRKLIGKYLSPGESLPDIPGQSPAIEIDGIQLHESASVFDHLPALKHSSMPKPMEFFYQNYGCILYRTKLRPHQSGKLVLTEVHDYANVYLNRTYIGSLDRTKHQESIDIPPSPGNGEGTLEILVEGMGRVNYGQHIIDRKGITEGVTLAGNPLLEWDVFNLPMDEAYFRKQKFVLKDTVTTPGAFFRGTFDLQQVGDTYLDMSKWMKGVVWINGRNLGRYWNIGPQQRLFIPAPWLRKGENEITVFDLHLLQAASLNTRKTLRE